MKHRETHVIFSPIGHSHPMSKFMPDNTNNFDFWVTEIDLHIIDRCDEVWVVCQEGWRQSRGVQAEIVHANTIANIPVRYVNPETLEVSDKC